MTKILLDAGKLNDQQFKQMAAWFTANPSVIEPEVLNELDLALNAPRMSFKDRIATANHPLTKRLFRVINEKRSNLCVSLDVDRSADVLAIADKVGPLVCMVKLHVDIIKDFNFDNLVKPLKALAEKHDFLIFEDRCVIVN